MELTAFQASVVNSIPGKGGDLVRTRFGAGIGASAAAASDAPAKLQKQIANFLAVEGDPPQSFKRFADMVAPSDPVVMLYWSMFEPDDVPYDFLRARITEAVRDRGLAVKAFADVVPLLKCSLPPPTRPAPQAPEPLPRPSTIPRGGDLDPDALADAIGLPALAPRPLLAVLIAAHYVPGLGRQTRVREIVEARLGLTPTQKARIGEAFDAAPTLSPASWSRVLATLGEPLPEELSAWFPRTTAAREEIAIAVTQPNTLELIGAAFPAPGTATLRRVRAERDRIRADFPDLGAWLVAAAFRLGAVREA